MELKFAVAANLPAKVRMILRLVAEAGLSELSINTAEQIRRNTRSN